MTAIFIDTNIFLHYRFFVEIPWDKMYGEDFQLVLTLTVISELDKHKRNPNPKIASRAKQVLSRIDGLQKQTDGFPLLVFQRRPGDDIFEKHQLDRREQDDCILATIIEYTKAYPEHHTLFISNDTGPRLRAAYLEINTEELPVELQNPTEPSDEQKQIKILKKELDLLKNAMPRLKVSFSNGTEIIRTTLTGGLGPKKETIEGSFKQVLEDYPFLEFDNPLPKNEKVMELLNATKFEHERKHLMYLYDPFDTRYYVNNEINRYNEAIKAFHSNVKSYLECAYDHELMGKLTVKLAFELHNSGNAPADEIDIWLQFPDGFMLAKNEGLPKEPIIPKAPERPTHNFSENASTFEILPHFNDERPYLPIVHEFEKPVIRPLTHRQVHLNVKTLKHTRSCTLGEFFVIYHSFSEVANFKVDYKILANNIPEPIKGVLHIVADVHSDPTNNP